MAPEDAPVPQTPEGRPTNARRRLLLAAGIVVGAAVIVGYAVDWRQLIALLSRADLRLVGGGVVAAILGIACWGEAMRLLLPPGARTLSRRRGFLVYATGSLVRNVLPVGYAGSIAVLAYVFRREAAVPIDRSLATVSVAELLNALASVALMLVGLLVVAASAREPTLARWLAAAVGAVVVGLALLAALLFRRRSAVLRVVHGFAVLLTQALELLPGQLARRRAPDDLEAALAEYYRSLSLVSGRRRAVAAALVLSAAGWLATIGALLAAGAAIGYAVPVGVALVVVPLGSYATVLPVPGGLGGYELGVAGLLHLLAGADLVTALAVTLLFRLCAYWAVVAVGTATSSYLSVDLRRLATAPRSEHTAVEDDGPSDG